MRRLPGGGNLPRADISAYEARNDVAVKRSLPRHAIRTATIATIDIPQATYIFFMNASTAAVPRTNITATERLFIYTMSSVKFKTELLAPASRTRDPKEDSSAYRYRNQDDQKYPDRVLSWFTTVIALDLAALRSAGVSK